MPSQAPSFVRVLDSALYVMPRGPADAGWCGYLLGCDDDPPSEPISIAQAFRVYNGHFLFALSAPSLASQEQAEAFSAAVRAYLDRAFAGGGRFTGQACVWIPDPKEPSFGPASGYAFSWGWGASTTILFSNLNNPIGSQVTLSVPEQVGLSASDDGLLLSGVGEAALSFLTSPPRNGPTIDPNEARLPFIGPCSGCLVFAGEIPLDRMLPFFQAGVRYLHPEGDGDVCQVFPVLAEQGGSLPYAGAVDPLDPLNEGAAARVSAGALRTLLAPVGAPQLASFLRTATGAEIALVPLGGADAGGQPVARAGALVFGRSGPNPRVGAVHLTFAGDWGIAVAGSGAQHDLLLGLSGLERIGFRGYVAGAACDRLRFVPHCAAYAPHFPFEQAGIANPAKGGDLLDTTYLTSWATVVPGDAAPVEYCAQPEGSPLYDGDAGGAETVVLDWLRLATPLPPQPVPLAPYAGVGESQQSFPTDQLPAFESQVLAAQRRRTIAAASMSHLRTAKLARLGDDPHPTTLATTPQGFLVEIAGASYARVTLARSAAGPDLAFVDPDAELQSLLQTNQLFAAIVDPAHLGAPTAAAGAGSFANRVTIAGWAMEVDVGRGATATDYRNVLILKFCTGTLQERVASPGMWTDVAGFSILSGSSDPELALTGLSQWLQQYVHAAVQEAAAGNTLYRDFAAIATDPSWQGILALRADMEPSDLPAEIRGLMAGIDFSSFTAHHFGATVTPITPQGETIGISGLSSLFGLIDYELPAFRNGVAQGGDPDVPLALPTDGPYGFSVLQLQALFRNTALVDFASRIQLTAGELFGSRVTAAYGPRGRVPSNAVVLLGSYVDQGGNPTYVFTAETKTVFTLDSNLLQALACDRVQFNTLSSGEADGVVRSRLLVWGELDFVALHDRSEQLFDALSFGSAPPTAPPQLGAGLSFANLALELRSAEATPNAVTYAFDASGLALDLGTSCPREGSLFTGFALQLSGFIAAPAGKRPADYGYLPVSMGVPQEELDGTWYGVVYKLLLGGPGALVATTGFESRLLLAWTPQTRASDSSYAAFCGVSLPGAAPGAKLFSVEGVLKLSIDSVTLLYEEVAGGNDKVFTLRLQNVGLKLLGFVKLPPGATINFFLFGDPKGAGSLGWYAAYVADQGEGLAPVSAGPAELEAGS